MSKLKERLSSIQRELKAPKNLRNTFGNYNYRNAEGILEAVKPLLVDGLSLHITSNPILVGMSGHDDVRFYIKTDVTLSLGEETITVSSSAREPFEKKGMDTSQISGACESYSKKYALSNLFLLDDTKDADSDEYQKQTSDKKQIKEAKPSRFQRDKPTDKTPKVETESVGDSSEASPPIEDKQPESQAPTRTSFRRLTRNK